MLTEEQKQLSKILESIAEELDIPDSKFEDAKNKYEAVGNWLGHPDCNLNECQPTIFPHGSIRLGTPVKPLGKDEYDIDLACRLQIPSTTRQDYVYNLVGDRLKDHGKYRSILEPKNRCWRLNYAGEFHMDILPAIPDKNRNDTSLLIPDKELKCWKQSNPEGYADWFLKRMESIRLVILKEADIEDVPEYKIRTPLQRAVQLLKRHRDIVFMNDLDDRPISIMITTLAAKAYRNEADLYEALVNIVDGMPKQFDVVNGELAVLNPTNEEENFADKWRKHPQRREKFLRWLYDLRYNLELVLKTKGLPKINEVLAPMFGKNIAEGAWKRYSLKNEQLREKQLLKINPATGIIGSTGVSIKKNTFYGE
jgi:hypothetical protein